MYALGTWKEQKGTDVERQPKKRDAGGVAEKKPRRRSHGASQKCLFLYRTAPYKIFTFYSSNLRKRMVNMEAAATMGDPFLAGVQKHEKDATFHRRCVFCV